MQKQNRAQFITPSNLYTEAEKRYRELIRVKEDREHALSKAPAGKIHIVTGNNRTQYYLRVRPSDRSGTYMPKTDPEKIRIYTQKAYDEKIVRLLDREISALDDYLHHAGQTEDLIRRVYSERPQEAREYIDPVDIPDEDYVRIWMEQVYERKEISEDLPVYETERGERVRSKSELTIANALAKHRIPYKYECPMILKNGRKIHPDFTVLNVKKRKQLYWEHRGMMDDPSYAKHSVDRIKQYMKNGIMIGKDLIITEESAAAPLGTDEIEAVIKSFFL